MLKKEDLWGQFSGRMSTSPRTGLLPQQNTHTYIHSTPTTHHTPHMPHTHSTHTYPLLQPLSLTAGRTSETGLDRVPLSGLTEEVQAPRSPLSTNLATSAPLYALGRSRPSPCECVSLLPCFLLTSFKPLFCSLII